MNPLLNRLQPYPFERLRQLFAGVTPNPALQAISLGIGEPRHATPDFIKQAMANRGYLVAMATTGTGLAKSTISISPLIPIGKVASGLLVV